VDAAGALSSDHPGSNGKPELGNELYKNINKNK
jgi:hypothetical protein